MAKYKDANPVAGASGDAGMLNDDGRELGSAYNSQDVAKMSAKLTYSPNEDVPSLGSISGVKE